MSPFRSMLLLLLISLAGKNTAATCAMVAETNTNTDAVFWKITGKGLKEPSYLFGTFHLLTSAYVDSLPSILDKFNACKTFAGELVIDSTVAPTMSAASVLRGTSLDQLLSPEVYQKTAAWLKEMSGYDLSLFNTLNPMTVSIVITMFIQQQLFPPDPNHPKPGMDEYFQTLSKMQGKTIIGLETAQDQVYVMYTQFTNERQAELLEDMVLKKDSVASMMMLMNTQYRTQNLNQLLPLMYDSSFTEKEVNNFLANRNIKWMQKLPALMQQSSVFVAVGALHLVGENGLVDLLRKEGYTVEPLQITGA